jgi:pimeloyl-ACP methyl ester carboxylesterase
VTRTELVDLPSGGHLEYLVAGVGPAVPVTVFAHGRGSSIAETRPLGSGVPGRKVFFHFRGYGRSSPAPDPWHPADDLRVVADHVGGTRAVGASLGAAAVCLLLAEQPDRFSRVVLYLPAVLPPVPPDVPVLVIGCRGDAVHPVEVAEQLAAASPQGVLHVFDHPDPICSARAELRVRITGFLGESGFRSAE